MVGRGDRGVDPLRYFFSNLLEQVTEPVQTFLTAPRDPVCMARGISVGAGAGGIILGTAGAIGGGTVGGIGGTAILPGPGTAGGAVGWGGRIHPRRSTRCCCRRLRRRSSQFRHLHVGYRWRRCRSAWQPRLQRSRETNPEGTWSASGGPRNRPTSSGDLKAGLLVGRNRCAWNCDASVAIGRTGNTKSWTKSRLDLSERAFGRVAARLTWRHSNLVSAGRLRIIMGDQQRWVSTPFTFSVLGTFVREIKLSSVAATFITRPVI